MKRLITEPLVQFLLLGILLYSLTNVFVPEKLSLDSSDDFHQIAVNDDVLRSYLQYQRKSFNSEIASETIASLDNEQQQTLIENYVRDEALFREALSLGLDNQDDIIKRRLIQKMEYLAQGFYDDIKPISESELEIYFQQNIGQYKVSAAISFTHVFISTHDDALNKAEKLVHELNDKYIDFESAGQYGERFLYNLNYIERTHDYIESHFGQNFKELIFLLDSSNQWQGPIQSEHGYHLVLIKMLTSSRSPTLEEVAEVVLADAQREQQRSIKVKAITEIINKYKVTTTKKYQSH